jgi:hypothetical protein
LSAVLQGFVILDISGGFTTMGIIMEKRNKIDMIEAEFEPEEPQSLRQS